MGLLGWILASLLVGFGMGWFLARHVRRGTRPSRDEVPERIDFVRALCHGIRNPLSGIQLLVDYGLEETSETACRETLERIQRQVSALTHVLTRFSEANALDGGRLVFTPQRVDLSDLAIEASELHGGRIRAKGQTLSITAPRPGPVAWADPAGIQRILEHLLSNASIFSPKGANIRLQVDAEGGYGRIRVSDDGPGISEAERERIFEPFAQRMNQPTEGEPCAGLGLSVARRLARTLGGELRLEPSEGVGSTFVLRFPKEG